VGAGLGLGGGVEEVNSEGHFAGCVCVLVARGSKGERVVGARRCRKIISDLRSQFWLINVLTNSLK
jgi:hypothetical protein